MITLCMDTSNKFLVLTVLKDNEIAASCNLSSWKRQSELIFPKLQECMSTAGCTAQDIDQVVITKGPGSYTGVRIAMTIAKVMCRMANIPLYTLSSLRLIASDLKKAAVVLDARGKRGYFAIYEQGNLQGEEKVLTVDEIKQIISENPDLQVVGDASILGMEDVYPDLCESFLHCQPQWKLQENVDVLVPEYLKSNEEYLVKKA